MSTPPLLPPSPPALTPPELIVRPVLTRDAATVWRACFPERPRVRVEQMIGRAMRAAAQGNGLGVVAAERPDPHTLIGYGQVLAWGRCAEISDLAVTPALRRRGIGTALIGYLLRAACEMQLGCVEIGADATNSAALALYQRLGFAESHRITLGDGEAAQQVVYLRRACYDPAVSSTEETP